MKLPLISGFHPFAVAAMSLALAACGGGSAGGGGKSVSRSGDVFTVEAESNALVCVDIHDSGNCSANAATATRSGADGSFQISFQADSEAAAQRFLNAAVVAEIADDLRPYTLTAPANAAQVNPLTTLVQRHVQRTGAALGDAEQAVAQQLGIAVEQIYQYRQQGTAVADNARTAAVLTRVGLQLGVPMRVHAAGDMPDTEPRLTSFNFKDAGNYDFHLHATDGTANGAGQLSWDAGYAGLIEGNPRSYDNSALAYETRNSTGYSGRGEYLRSRGNPARVQAPLHNRFTQGGRAALTTGLTDDAALFEMVVEDVDISHRPMADFIREMQAYEAMPGIPVEHSLFTLDADALRTGVFPAGSRMYQALRTSFSAAAVPAQAAGSSSETSSHGEQPNDLAAPASMLGGYGQPVRVQQSLNGTAWEAIRKELNLSERPTEQSRGD